MARESDTEKLLKKMATELDKTALAALLDEHLLCQTGLKEPCKTCSTKFGGVLSEFAKNPGLTQAQEEQILRVAKGDVFFTWVLGSFAENEGVSDRTKSTILDPMSWGSGMEVEVWMVEQAILSMSNNSRFNQKEIAKLQKGLIARYGDAMNIGERSQRLTDRMTNESNEKEIDKLMAEHWSCMGSDEGSGNCDLCEYRAELAIWIFARNTSLTEAQQEKIFDLLYTEDNYSGVAVLVLDAFASNTGISDFMKNHIINDPEEQFFRWLDSEDKDDIAKKMIKNPSFSKAEIKQFKENWEREYS